jgi:hypothetical protein
MLEDAAQSYNPIIQAMIATANLQKQGQQQDIEKERNKQLAEQSKASLAAETKRIENEHEHQLATIDLMGKAHSLAAEAQSMQTTSMLRDLAAKGVDVGKLGLSGLFTGGLTHGANPKDQLNTPPGVLPQGAAPISNATPVAGFTPVQSQGQTPDFSSAFPGPEAEAARVRGLAGAQAGGAAEGELPFQQQLARTKFENEQTLQNARLAAEQKLSDSRLEVEQKLANLHINSAETIAKLSRSSQERMTAATNQTHLQAMGMDPNTNRGMVQSMYLGALTGDYKLNPSVNPLERIVYNQVQQSGGHLVDPKEALGLREAQKLVPLFDKLETFAKELPTGPGGAWAQGHTVGLANTLGIPTDLQNKINIINSQAMNVGKATEGITGRPLAQQMKLDLDSLATPGITKDQFIERINNLRQNYINNQDNVFFSGMPDFQKELIKHKYGLVHIDAKSPQSQRTYSEMKIGPNEHKIGKSNGKWYDVQTGEELK